MGTLEGKALVITGAGRGLGEAYARHAAASGAAVVVNDVDEANAEKVAISIVEAGGQAVAGPGSVADPEVAEGLVELCRTRFGRLDGLVNNAAIGYHTPVWHDDAARARELIETNVLGAMHCGIAAAKVLREQRSGSIVNASSGSMLGHGGAAAYAASKGALASLTYSWALDLADHGVRVNAISPVAWTPLMAADPNSHAFSPEDFSPDRIAPLVTYLLSDLAAGITGQLVRFTGEKLHMVAKAGIAKPVLRQDDWTVDDIADAFTGALAPALSPVTTRRWQE
jgi:NAD(P)-dependent dehydrogenase (short-subunit alcohol dehydrogenase family)